MTLRLEKVSALNSVRFAQDLDPVESALRIVALIPRVFHFVNVTIH